jgi:hypothetical protein
MRRLKVSVVGADMCAVGSLRIGKAELRAAIRARHGEPAWMRVQAEVYGRRIDGASTYAGFFAFVEQARAAGAWLGIVSHKTEFAAAAPEGPSLREAARGWLAAAGVYERGIEPQAVHFEATRGAKIARIAELGCTHFIDDLPEVFTEPAFPAGVDRILFAPDAAEPGPYLRAASWDEIRGLLFGA